METEHNIRIADNPEVIGSNHVKRPVLLGICRIKRDRSYLLTGTLRRSSSEKFSRKITWLYAFCASAVSTGIKAAMCLPSGERNAANAVLVRVTIIVSSKSKSDQSRKQGYFKFCIRQGVARDIFSKPRPGEKWNGRTPYFQAS